MISTTKKPGQRTPIGLLLVGTLLVLTLLLAACGSTTTTTTTTTPGGAPTPDLKVPGVLTVGSDTTYPPQESIDTATNKAVGFDVDLITAIAKNMGLQANVVTTKFDTIIDDLNNKRFDVVISAVSVTPDRQKKVDFVPYFNAGESLLVQVGNPKNIKGLSDLCGQSVGVQTGTIEQADLQTASNACKTAGKPEIKMVVLQDQTAVIQLLANQRVVATYQDSPVTDYYNKQHPGQFAVGGSVINAGLEGIVIRKNDAPMFNAVKAAFDKLKADGTYKQLIDKWGLTNEAIAMVDRRTNFA
ncbi:MAG: ABC transporter substrate-binding protein [Chloroflexi bacterium]|nr:MAG: ABC transporter substrate-binding protein [Chloroflexota bacterium]